MTKNEIVGIEKRAFSSNVGRKTDPFLRVWRYKLIVLFITTITTNPMKLPKLLTKLGVNQRNTQKNHRIHPISHALRDLGRCLNNVPKNISDKDKTSQNSPDKRDSEQYKQKETPGLTLETQEHPFGGKLRREITL